MLRISLIICSAGFPFPCGMACRWWWRQEKVRYPLISKLSSILSSVQTIMRLKMTFAFNSLQFVMENPEKNHCFNLNTIHLHCRRKRKKKSLPFFPHNKYVLCTYHRCCCYCYWLPYSLFTISSCRCHRASEKAKQFSLERCEEKKSSLFELIKICTQLKFILITVCVYHSQKLTAQPPCCCWVERNHSILFLSSLADWY